MIVKNNTKSVPSLRATISKQLQSKGSFLFCFLINCSVQSFQFSQKSLLSSKFGWVTGYLKAYYHLLNLSLILQCSQDLLWLVSMAINILCK